MKIRTHLDNTGLAPADQVWSAIGEDTYDGAPTAAPATRLASARPRRRPSPT
jgi:hypothetical protein